MTKSEHKEYHRKKSQEWEKKNKRWKDPKRREYLKSVYKSGSSTAINRKSLYGIAPEEYEKKRKRQRDKCALCGKKERRKHYKTGKTQSLSVDHDHKTGKVRDLLCRDCNVALGLFSDSVDLLLRAIKYLNRHKGVQWRIRNLKRKRSQF